MMMSRRLPAAGCLLLTLAGLAGRSAGASAADLLVAAPAGPLARLVDAAFVAPFVAAPPPAASTPAGSHQAAVLVSLAPGQTTPPVPADLSLVNGQALLTGCKLGAFRKLDWSAIGGRDRVIPAAATDCGMGAVLRGLVLAWSRDKFTGAPTWSDFWDVAKVPGKRGLRHGARGNLEFALIADGVAAADVYSTLRSDGGVDRAFRKLDQLKPYIVWWKTEDEAPRLLASGEVLMTSAPADGVLAAAKATSGVAPRDFAVQWAGALLMFESWVLLSNTKAADAAQGFLTFASDPKQQKALGAYPGFGSAVAGGADALGAAEQLQSPATPANFALGLVADEAFWRDNGERLDKQYEGWLAKP